MEAEAAAAAIAAAVMAAATAGRKPICLKKIPSKSPVE
jgi:hypothetical protein